MSEKPITKKALRLLVYSKYQGHCAYCGKEMLYKDMQVDHMTSQHNHGSDTIENLMPSCRRCNHYKRAMNLEGFRYHMKGLHDRIRNPYINKVALDYGIIKLEPFDGMFYFERLIPERSYSNV